MCFSERFMVYLRLLLSNSYDPWFNLSAEEYIFQNMIQNQSILFLWRNQNTVVIGRAQNAWKECNTRRMARDGIKLARRYSGGGAVFQDLGNTCFTFMSTQKNYNKHVSFDIILAGLNRLGIKASISGRNDLVVYTKKEQHKISGSAYRKTSSSQLHHGTLLLHTDLNKLTYYLNPDDKKLKTKGITSIKSRVINLNRFKSDINHKEVCQQLTKSFFQYYKSETLSEIISPDNFYNIPEFRKYFNKQRCWDWNFGSALSFTHYLDNRFSWGNIELYFDIHRGIINHSRVFTDSLNPDPLEDLAKKLIDIPYNINSIRECCKKWIKDWPQFFTELKEVINWLIENIS